MLHLPDKNNACCSAPYIRIPLNYKKILPFQHIHRSILKSIDKLHIRAKPHRKPQKQPKHSAPKHHSVARQPAENLFPGLLIAPEPPAPKVENPSPVQKVAPPTEAFTKEVFADFGVPSEAKVLKQTSGTGTGPVQRGSAEQKENPVFTYLQNAWERTAKFSVETYAAVQQFWRSHKRSVQTKPIHLKHKTVQHKKSHAKSPTLVDTLIALFQQHWKPISITTGCVLLFALGLFFALHDAAPPPTTNHTRNVSENVTTPTHWISVTWHGEQHVCTPE